MNKKKADNLLKEFSETKRDTEKLNHEVAQPKQRNDETLRSVLDRKREIGIDQLPESKRPKRRLIS